MAWRSRPHAHTCRTSPGWLASIVARLPEANVDLCRLEEDMRSVTHHEASKTCVGETVEARPVGVSPDGGH